MMIPHSNYSRSPMLTPELAAELGRNYAAERARQQRQHQQAGQTLDILAELANPNTTGRFVSPADPILAELANPSTTGRFVPGQPAQVPWAGGNTESIPWIDEATQAIAEEAAAPYRAAGQQLANRFMAAAPGMIGAAFNTLDTLNQGMQRGNQWVGDIRAQQASSVGVPSMAAVTDNPELLALERQREQIRGQRDFYQQHQRPYSQGEYDQLSPEKQAMVRFIGAGANLGRQHIPGSPAAYQAAQQADRAQAERQLSAAMQDHVFNGNVVARQDASGRAYFRDNTPASNQAIDGRLAYAQQRQKEREALRGVSPSGEPSGIQLTTAQMRDARDQQGNRLYSDLRNSTAGDPARREESQTARDAELAARNDLVTQRAMQQADERRGRLAMRQGKLPTGELDPAAALALMAGNPIAAAQIQSQVQMNNARLAGKADELAIQKQVAEADAKLKGAQADALARGGQQTFTDPVSAAAAGPEALGAYWGNQVRSDAAAAAANPGGPLPPTVTRWLRDVYYGRKTEDGQFHNWDEAPWIPWYNGGDEAFVRYAVNELGISPEQVREWLRQHGRAESGQDTQLVQGFENSPPWH